MRFRRLVVLLLGGLVILTACQPPPFGPSEGGTRYTDNATVTHRSVECNNADFLHFNHYVHFTMLDDYNPTDLTTKELTPGACLPAGLHDDIYWYATPGSSLGGSDVTGDYWCQVTSGSDKCDKARVRFKEEMRTDGTSEAVKWNTACHEVAHAIGFSHGDTGQSCMDGGDNGVLDDYMKGRINDRW